MHDVMVFYDEVSDQIFLVYCYISGHFETCNLPDRFKDLIGQSSNVWFDDFLLENDCIHLGSLYRGYHVQVKVSQFN